MEVFVIQERDLKAAETMVIGVVDSVDKVDGILKEYYGEYEVKIHQEIKRDELVSVRELVVMDYDTQYITVEVWVLSFELNKI